ncbi:hypothetical protein ACFQJC_14580 [Haloferax namakaokahaiae]|uniref:Uncharacterized protein n=1 Tax=Haloferax namakaokahaiae TaxID=1748331 RepID=A0ABD5ZIM1_9EURY
MRDRRRQTSVDIDLDDNEATVEIVERRRRRVPDLFDEDGELRLWEDNFGWSGYKLEDGRFFRVNYHKRNDEWLEHSNVSPDDVVESIRDHIKDPKAGAAGRFVRRCSPP